MLVLVFSNEIFSGFHPIHIVCFRLELNHSMCAAYVKCVSAAWKHIFFTSPYLFWILFPLLNERTSTTRRKDTQCFSLFNKDGHVWFVSSFPSLYFYTLSFSSLPLSLRSFWLPFSVRWIVCFAYKTSWWLVFSRCYRHYFLLYVRYHYLVSLFMISFSVYS